MTIDDESFMTCKKNRIGASIVSFVFLTDKVIVESRRFLIFFVSKEELNVQSARLMTERNIDVRIVLLFFAIQASFLPTEFKTEKEL